MTDHFHLLAAKANAEIDDLNRSLAAVCAGVPVIGSGDPLADIFFVKERPDADEESAKAAFAGSSGDVILKAADRLGLPPGAMYGTNLLKCRLPSPSCADKCRAVLEQELGIVQPRLVFAMGEVAFLAASAVLGSPLEFSPGATVRRVGRPTLIGSVDLDAAMTDESAKRQLWRDLKLLGGVYSGR